jgi:hypothetical protein
MMSASGALQPGFLSRFCCLAACLLAPAASGAVQDARVLCNANDHEILWNALVYQLPVTTEAANQHAFVRRLVPNPPLDDIREQTVFDGPAHDFGGGLPPLSQSSNGPELGFDAAHGVEVVYTLEDTATNEWSIARQANYCLRLEESCWSFLEIPNTNPDENRWKPFVTASLSTRAKIVYFRTPGPRDVDVRVAWRDLEDPDPAHEHVIDDPNVTGFGRWAEIGGQPFLVVIYGPLDAENQVALYDVTPPYRQPPLQIVTSGPGIRSEAAATVDPASGRPTVVTANTIGDANVLEVYQRIDGVWTHLYDFDAAQAGETNPSLAFVQSAEFFSWRNRLYFAFLTSDTDSFATTTRGNLRITRVEPEGPPTYFKVLNDESIQRKRTEPEIHFPSNDAPVVFYTLRTEVPGEDGCNANNNTLRRARTLVTR